MRDDIRRAIDMERDRQQEKWGGTHRWGQGDCSSAMVTRTVKVAVLTEECGEVARAVLEDDDMGLVEELIQVAAVAIAWIEGEMDR